MHPSIDHSLLSPSGRVSKRARETALRREGERLFAGVNLNPPPSEAEQRQRKVESLRRHAARLRQLADSGMRPKYHRKHAAEAEAQADSLANAEGGRE